MKNIKRSQSLQIGGMRGKLGKERGAGLNLTMLLPGQKPPSKPKPPVIELPAEDHNSAGILYCILARR